MELSAISMGKVEDFLETIPSKHTRKNYVNGIKKFELEPCFCPLLIFIIMGL